MPSSTMSRHGTRAPDAVRTDGVLDPAPLLVRYHHRLKAACTAGPVLDLACGNGHNGLYLAAHGATVKLVDRDATRLATVRELADRLGLRVLVREADLEQGMPEALQPMTYAAVLVFRYLHRPLIPFIRDAVQPGGWVVYETFTKAQRRYGRPHNPDYLLECGELTGWFKGWDIVHAFEGERVEPRRAVAQIVCRKPGARRGGPSPES